MIQFIPLLNIGEFSVVVQRLYEESFPPNERRNWPELTGLIQNENFSANQIFSDEKFIGLLFYWKFSDFIFIEHFAILPSERSRGLGTDTIKQFIEYQQLPILLEVEIPETENAQKRIRFYDRLNFRICPEKYFQPAYTTGKAKVDMLLMSYPDQISHSDFESVVNKIHQSVYQYSE